MEAFLWHYVDHLQTDWADWLVIVEFQYNDKLHSSTNHTLFYLNYRWHPWKGEIQLMQSSNHSANKFIKTLEMAQEEAAAAMAKALERAKANYDHHKRTSPNRRSSMAGSHQPEGGSSIEEAVGQTVWSLQDPG